MEFRKKIPALTIIFVLLAICQYLEITNQLPLKCIYRRLKSKTLETSENV